ncbi:calcium-binding protein, partial [Methylobacterium sp. A54F]
RDKAYQPILGLGTNTLVSNSRFVDLPSDGISIASGRITGNLISGGGYQTGAHADAIAISGFATNGAIQITDNLIDWRTPADAKVATNQAIRATSDKGP